MVSVSNFRVLRNVLVAVVQAHQEAQDSGDIGAALFPRLDRYLLQVPEQPAIIETTLTIIGKLARYVRNLIYQEFIKITFFFLRSF